jgi:hypothetical protein
MLLRQSYVRGGSNQSGWLVDRAAIEVDLEVIEACPKKVDPGAPARAFRALRALRRACWRASACCLRAYGAAYKQRNWLWRLVNATGTVQRSAGRGAKIPTYRIPHREGLRQMFGDTAVDTPRPR